METIANPPTQSSLIETNDQIPTRKDPFYMAKSWIVWLFESLVPRVQQASQLLLAQAMLTGKHASIGSTSLPLAILAAGRYRTSWYVRITTPDTLGSSVQVTIGWTEGGQPLTLSGSVLNGNVVTAVEIASLLLVVDRATAITYATTWAATTGDGRYELAITVEQVD